MQTVTINLAVRESKMPTLGNKSSIAWDGAPCAPQGGPSARTRQRTVESELGSTWLEQSDNYEQCEHTQVSMTLDV